MQKIGRFLLGEKYYYNELTELFSAMLLFRDYSHKKGAYIALTETHLLMFKECETPEETKKKYAVDKRKTESTVAEHEQADNDRSEETSNELQLISHAELQCIDTVYYKESEKHIRIIYKKYQSIKLYH
jgi:hypothetical protein